MKQSSKRLVSIIVALVFIILALIIFFDVVQPEYNNVMEVKGQLAAENQFLQTATQSVSAVQKVISAYQQDAASEQSVAMALPAEQDTAGALAQIYGLAQNNGIVIQSLTIAAPTIQVQTTTQTTIKPLGSLAFQITAAGSYESLKNFLAGLESNIRIFDLKGISITPAQTAPGATNHDFFTYTLTVVTYYQTN